MMNYFKFLILSCLFFLSGCDKGDNKNPTAPSQELSYLPLKIGATWTYKETRIENGNEFTDTTAIGIDRTEKIIQNNKTYFVVVSEENEEFLRIESNKVYRYVPGMEEIPILDFDIEIGETWVIFTQNNNIGSWIMTGKFLGTENITVPAGSFINCAKFESIVLTNIFDNTGNVRVTYKLTEVAWYAPDVGLVKSTEENKEVNEVIADTLITELINYNIPE